MENKQTISEIIFGIIKFTVIVFLMCVLINECSSNQDRNDDDSYIMDSIE